MGWRLKLSASPVFAQPFVQAQIKENTKAPRHWALWGESTGDGWFLHTKGQLREKCFHLMMLSWLHPVSGRHTRWHFAACTNCGSLYQIHIGGWWIYDELLSFEYWRPPRILVPGAISRNSHPGTDSFREANFSLYSGSIKSIFVIVLRKQQMSVMRADFPCTCYHITMTS